MEAASLEIKKALNNVDWRNNDIDFEMFENLKITADKFKVRTWSNKKNVVETNYLKKCHENIINFKPLNCFARWLRQTSLQVACGK